MTALNTLFCILAICGFYWIHIIREKKTKLLIELPAKPGQKKEE